MDLHHIHREDVFGPCSDEFECQGQKSKGQGHHGKKRGFRQISLEYELICYIHTEDLFGSLLERV